MGITQGSALPDVKVTTTKADTAPGYYTDYLQSLSDVGQTYIGKPATDTTAAIPGRTAAEGIAGMDPLQTQGYGMVPSGASAYQGPLQQAMRTAGTAAAGIDTSRIGELMDPYRANVVGEMGRLQQQNIQRNVLPSMKAGFVGQGALGSQRYAGALGQTMAEMQSNLTGQQYGALSKGYGDALKASLDELQLQNEAARTQTGLAEKAQSLGLTEAGALTKAGAERQAFEQAKLDYPLKTALEAAGLMRGMQVPTTQTETRTGPLPGAYETSDLANTLAILTTLGSIKTGGGSSVGGDILSSIGRGIKELLPTGLGELFGGDFKVEPSEFVGLNDNGVPLYFDGQSGKYYDYNGREVVTLDESGASITG